MQLKKPGKYSPSFPFHILSCLSQLSPDLLYLIHAPSILNISSVSFPCFLPQESQKLVPLPGRKNSQSSLPLHHLYHQFSIFSLNQNHLENLLTRFLGTTVSSGSVTWDACVHVMLLQLYPTLCDPMDCSLPGSCVHGILQVRILVWGAMPSSRGSFRPRDKPTAYISCFGRQVL